MSFLKVQVCSTPVQYSRLCSDVSGLSFLFSAKERKALKRLLKGLKFDCLHIVPTITDSCATTDEFEIRWFDDETNFDSDTESTSFYCGAY